VVGGDQRHAAERIDDRQDARQLQVDRLDGHRRGAKAAGVSNHVAIGEVAAQGPVLAALQSFDHGVGNLGGLHPGALFKGHDVTRHFLVGLAVELV
jgi:hypothetical protein